MASNELIKTLQREQFSKIIKTLKSDIKEAKKNGNLCLTLNLNGKQSGNNKEYATDLINQIKEKNERDQIEKNQYKELGFSNEISGYPNIPQTPKEIKRKKNLEQMKKMKQDLDIQIESKNKLIKESILNEKNLDQKINTEIFNQLCLEKQQKLEKQQQDKEELLTWWQNAQQARQLKQKLEEINIKGFSPKLKKKNKEENNIKTPELKYRSKDIRSVSPLPVLETEISTRQLSSKINKAIQNAKDVRKSFIRSQSPTKKNS